jgi:hypothetical protein
LIKYNKHIKNLFSIKSELRFFRVSRDLNEKKVSEGSDNLFKMVFFTFLALLFFSVTTLSQINVTTDLLQEREVLAGSSFRGEIVIRNYGNEAGVIKAYQTDVYSTCDGKYFYNTPDSAGNNRSNSKWVTFSPSYFILPSKSSSRINYAVEVPNDDNLKGSYYSIIMVEVVGDEKDIEDQVNSKSKKKKPNLGLTVNYRFASLILTHIQNTGLRKIIIKGINLTKDKSQYLLELQVENTGERVLRPDISVELFNIASGSKISVDGTEKFVGTKSVIYPGSCTNQTIKIGPIDPGNFKALVVIDAGGEDVFGAEYNLTIGNK